MHHPGPQIYIPHDGKLYFWSSSSEAARIEPSVLKLEVTRGRTEVNAEIGNAVKRISIVYDLLDSVLMSLSLCGGFSGWGKLGPPFRGNCPEYLINPGEVFPLHQE